MSKIKAVVLENSGTHYTVLDTEGTFRQVKRRLNAEVGEEIEVNVVRGGFWRARVWVGVAALFLMTLTSLVGWNLYQAPTAVALVSVDINPSLEFTLDSQGRFIKLQTQNQDARQLLGQQNFKGKLIDEVLKEIVTLAYNQNFINSESYWIVVGYSPMTDKSIDKMPKELNNNQISDWLTESIEHKGVTPQVAVFSLAPDEKELAQKEDLTLGELALWQTAQRAGVITQPEKLKDTSERVRILENPRVQELVKFEKQENDKSLPPSANKLIVKPGSIGNSSERGLGKQLPNSLHFSNPIENPVIEKGRKPMAEKKQPSETDVNKDYYKTKKNNNENGENKDKDIDIDKDIDNDIEREIDLDRDSDKDRDRDNVTENDIYLKGENVKAREAIRQKVNGNEKDQGNNKYDR